MFNNRNLIIIGAVVIVVFAWLGISRGKKDVVLDSVQTAAKVSVKGLHDNAQKYKEDRDLLQAKAVYQKILNDHPDYENVELVQKELEKINMEIIFSNIPTPKAVMHEVKSGDTLGELAKQYKTTIDLIKLSNHLKSNVIRIGQRLKIWTGTFNIFIDKSQNILMLKDEGDIVKVYDVSTGENNNTPVGEFKIVSKLIDPVWFNRGVVVPPESPQNVLGSRWLGFDIPGYGIHGTIEPETIGKQVTAGCVRMRNEDVEELYSIIPLGTEVVIVD